MIGELGPAEPVNLQSANVFIACNGLVARIMIILHNNYILVIATYVIQDRNVASGDVEKKLLGGKTTRH